MLGDGEGQSPRHTEPASRRKLVCTSTRSDGDGWLELACCSLLVLGRRSTDGVGRMILLGKLEPFVSETIAVFKSSIVLEFKVVPAVSVTELGSRPRVVVVLLELQ